MAAPDPHRPAAARAGSAAPGAGSEAPAAAADGASQRAGDGRDLLRAVAAGARIERELYQAEYPPLPASLRDFVRGEGAAPRPATEPGDELPPGTVVDGYRILGVIGRGGMGVVYEARQLALGRLVALKVLPAGVVSTPRAVDRFRREAQAVARLSHPRIVAVHGFSQSGGLACLAMERVRGHDLARVIDRLRSARTRGRRFVRISGPRLDDADDLGAWAAGRKLAGTMPGDPRLAEGIVVDLRNYAHMAAAMALDAADALRHAHAHGVIHRDVKPSNLILSSSGRIKLSDFGLAKDLAEESMTHSGDFLGSPQYVSPEQAGSRRARVDERSDIYSLGLTLYELLTLHMPFTGPNVAVILRQILSVDPPAPTRINPRLPRDLETIVCKAIEKDPDRRYQSAEELGDDLRRFLNFEPIAARPLGPLARAVRGARRHRTTLVVVGLAGAVLALVVVLLAQRWDGARPRPAPLASAPLATDASAAAVAALVEQLGAPGLSRAERAERRERIGLVADQLLALGARVEVGELVELVRRGLPDLDEIDRRLLAEKLARVEVELLAGLREELIATRPGAAGRRELLRLVERRLRNDDPRVVKGAAEVLGEVGAASALGALLDTLHDRPDRFGRVAVIDALGRLGQSAAVGPLVARLGDPDPFVRYAALEALDRLDPPDFVRLVEELATDPERWVRGRWQHALAARAGR